MRKVLYVIRDTKPDIKYLIAGPLSATMAKYCREFYRDYPADNDNWQGKF